MSVANVCYKKCTCDACGKVENIQQDTFLPRYWSVVKIDTRNIDLCDVCFTKVCNYINSLFPKEEK